MKGTWAVVVLIALAGCTVPEEETVDIWQACPQWVAGAMAETNTTVDGSVELALNASIVAPEMDGRPFDMVVLTLRSDAPISLRIEVDGGRVLLQSAGGDDQPALQFNGEVEVQAFLSPVVHGSSAAGTPVLILEGDGVVELTVEPFYRVCGVPDVPES